MSFKLDKIKQQLYSMKMITLFNKSLKEGKIVNFNEEFYKKMKDTYISCIPVSIWIKYLKPIIGSGMCYDRSLYMFFCFEDSLLVCASTKDLELRFGKEDSGHGWIEMGNYVYDPSLLMRFEKDLYYKIYGVTNAKKNTHSQYRKANTEFYDNIKNTIIRDYQPGGCKRTDLLTIIPFLEEIAKMSGNSTFIKEVNDYLRDIDYDYQEVMSELHKIAIDKKFISKKLINK